MQVHAVIVTPGERDALWDWWTDYSEKDHETHAFARYAQMRRRLIWHDPGKGAEYTDEGKVLGFPLKARTTVSLYPRERVHAHSVSNRGNMDLEIWFESLPGGGTRLTARGNIAESPEIRLLIPFTRAAVETGFAYDLRAHVAEFEGAHGL